MPKATETPAKDAPSTRPKYQRKCKFAGYANVSVKHGFFAGPDSRSSHHVRTLFIRNSPKEPCRRSSPSCLSHRGFRLSFTRVAGHFLVHSRLPRLFPPPLKEMSCDTAMFSRILGVLLLAAGLVSAKQQTFDFTITKGGVSPDGTVFQSLACNL